MQWAEKNYTASGILSISLIWVAIILKMEYKKRKEIAQDALNLNTPTSDNIYYKWLNRWSFLAIVSCLITSILYLCRYLPFVCIATVGTDQAFMYITKIKNDQTFIHTSCKTKRHENTVLRSRLFNSIVFRERPSYKCE